MRGEYVEERDANWERDDPRFRIFVFRGPANETTVMDIVDATIEQTLESAHALSEGDALLWSLALVDDSSRGSRGLIWLSGMDYNDRPTSATEWARRRQMQDRYLFAKVRRHEPPLLPNGLRVIRVFPEWGSGGPLWESFTDVYRLDAASLDISPELGRALFDWNEHWQNRGEDEPVPDAAAWRARGEHLVTRLAGELEGIAEVRPEFLTSSEEAG